jgi:hypothetical protein
MLYMAAILPAGRPGPRDDVWDDKKLNGFNHIYGDKEPA